MAKTINILPAVDVSNGALTVDVEITEGGHTHTQQYAFNADDFDCNCSSSSPYVAKFLFDPGDITMILEVQGDFTTCKFDGVTKASAYALAQDVIADIDQYKTAGGGGSYTFPTNHGNTAYVATGGNDGTGVVGNISKPFETATAAKDALDPADPGVIIILSAASASEINGYDYNGTNPYFLSINDLSGQGLSFTGTCSFGNLYAKTIGNVTVDTSLFFVCDDAGKIEANGIYFQPGCTGTAGQGISIECNDFNINVPTTSCSYDNFGYINWKNLISLNGQSITYSRCNPMVWKGRVSQTGTSAPTATVYDNTTGETLTFEYVDLGEYHIGSPGSKFTTKTFWSHPNSSGDMSPLTTSSIIRISSSELSLFSRDSFGDGNNDVLINLPLLIEIYP